MFPSVLQATSKRVVDRDVVVVVVVIIIIVIGEWME